MGTPHGVRLAVRSLHWLFRDHVVFLFRLAQCCAGETRRNCQKNCHNSVAKAPATDRYTVRRAKTLVAMAIFTALICCVSMANARADSTSQSASAYIAGKGKYCKETAVSGYLDCFCASLDACEKHNKSANVRCVANPNFGT
jgi:hypothetical protein